MRSKPKTRVRRTADDARAAIMDAAEKRLQEVGPAGIRLQDVAADVGVSHPTVLHHFGSREALVRSVIERRSGALERDLLAEMAMRLGAEEDPVGSMIESVARTLGPGGHARVVAWLALAGIEPTRQDGAGLDAIARASFELRKSRWKQKGKVPDFEDTYFVILLAALAVFGDAIAGPLLRGDPDPRSSTQTSVRFRKWLSVVIKSHLEGDD